MKDCGTKTGDRILERTYGQIICEAEQKWGIEVGAICKGMILSHLKANRKTIAAVKGNVSPLIVLVAHFLDIILQLASMN
jgi:hypothetical protein